MHYLLILKCHTVAAQYYGQAVHSCIYALRMPSKLLALIKPASIPVRVQICLSNIFLLNRHKSVVCNCVFITGFSSYQSATPEKKKLFGSSAKSQADILYNISLSDSKIIEHQSSHIEYIRVKNHDLCNSCSN